MFYAKCIQCLLHYKIWSRNRVNLDSEVLNALCKFKNDLGKIKFIPNKLKTGWHTMTHSFDNRTKSLDTGEFMYNFSWGNL